MSKPFDIATTVTYSYYPFLLSFLGSYFYQHRGGLAGKLFIGIDQFPESAIRKLSQYEGVELIPVIQKFRRFDGVHGDAWTHAVAKKLDMAKQIIAETQKPLLLIDNDILFIKPIDELFEVDHDIVVTHIESERERHVRKDGLPINFIASAIFFNTPEKSISFINEWQSVMKILTEKTVPPYETPALNVLLNQLASGSKNLGLSVGVIEDSVIASDQAIKSNTKAIHLKSWGPSKLSAMDNYWARCSRQSFDKVEFAPAHADYLALEVWFCESLYGKSTLDTNNRANGGKTNELEKRAAHPFIGLGHKKKRYIFADGGLANRLFALLYPLSRTAINDLEIQIFWPKTNWCDCDFTDLFESEISISPLHINSESIHSEISEDTLVLTHLTTRLAAIHEELNQADISDKQHFMDIWGSMERPVLYNHHSLPHFWTESRENLFDLALAFETLRPKQSIINRVNDFIVHHSINQGSTIGLHVRGTDFNPSEEKINKLKEFIENNSDKRIYLCSDDKKIKDRLSIYSSVLTTNYGSLVEYDESSARIYRSSDSVEFALSELLILSHTNIIKTSHSSFLSLSGLLGKLRSTLQLRGWT